MESVEAGWRVGGGWVEAGGGGEVTAGPSDEDTYLVGHPNRSLSSQNLPPSDYLCHCGCINAACADLAVNL